MADKDNEEKAGSLPANTEEGKEKTDVTADSSKAQDAIKEKSSDSEVPWHKDPRFKDDLKLLKIAKGLVEANGLEDFDDLVDLVKSGKKVHGKIKDSDDVDEIIKRAEENKLHHQYWEQQKEFQQRGQETPEQTIARLQRERDEERNTRAQRELAEQEKNETKRAIAFYEGEIQSQLESAEDLSSVEREIVAWSLGIGNECNEIQLTDKKAIKRIVNDGHKKITNWVKQIKEQAIKEYREGKTSIPSVPSTDGSAATTKLEPPKGFKGMRQALNELMVKKGS